MGLFGRLLGKKKSPGLAPPPPPPGAPTKEPVKVGDIGGLPPLPSHDKLPSLDELRKPPTMRPAEPPKMTLPSKMPEPSRPPGPPKHIPDIARGKLPEMEEPLMHGPPMTEHKEPLKAPPPKPILKDVPPSSTREAVKKSFADIPPITVTKDTRGMITDEHVREFDVDKFVLPGQEKKMQPPMDDLPRIVVPPKKPASRIEENVFHMHAPIGDIQPPQPLQESQPFIGPLFVDVKTYEDTLRTLNGLKKQLSETSRDIERISDLKEQEDKQFSMVVQKLEKIQDRLLSVDESLFEEKAHDKLFMGTGRK